MRRYSMKQPNVIVFFTDQQRWDTTGAGGNPCGLTPNFDRMAQELSLIHISLSAPAGIPIPNSRSG